MPASSSGTSASPITSAATSGVVYSCRSAMPVAAHAPRWEGTAGARGTVLAQQLHDFDREAGYGFAWYFHLVSAHRVPRSVAPEVFADLQDDLAYLPERDANLIHAWMHDPYAL